MEKIMRLIIEEYQNLEIFKNNYTALDAKCEYIASKFLEHEDNVLVIRAYGKESVTEDYGDVDIAKSLAGSILLLSNLCLEFTVSIER
jgi:hypothetical protein